MAASRHLDGLAGMTRRALASALAHARRAYVPPFAVDCTAGNGHDTLFLAREVGPDGRVWAFDVQEAAIAATRERLDGQGPDTAGRVTLIRAGHETLGRVLPPEAAGGVWAATLNLGYLPGGNKSLVTRPDTTLAALAALAPLMAGGGVISAHCYLGQEGGEDEGAAVSSWFRSLTWDSWRVAEYSFANKRRNREVLFLAEKNG